MSTNATRARRPVFARPLVLALVVTLANAGKPVLIDDTAYLTYARHIAADPLDPYGFDIFWYVVPEPAFGVLCPPVVPYWLGLGITLFGEHPALLRLWMFPFVWAFAWAVADLLWRFARGAESSMLPLVVLSPIVLPNVNLMLDLPALGLGLAAAAVFARATDRRSWRLVTAAGVLAGLAMQTKYTALLIPVAVAWYGLTHRRVGLAALAVAIPVAVFVGWELLMVKRYGESHFLHHATGQKPHVRKGEAPFDAFLREKSALGAPLVGHLGCLGIGVLLVAGSALGVGRRWLAGAAGVWAAGFLLVALLPYQWTVIVPGRPPDADLTATAVFWQSFGWLFLLGLAGCAALLTLRRQRVRRFRGNADAAFLVGWVFLELAGYFALTPFGAARRVIGLTVVGGLLATRALSRVERIRPTRRLPRWVIGFGVATGFAVAALDTLDAFAEKVCAERAAVVAIDRPPGATVWYSGHWGFQYYCERAGMKPVVPGKSVLQPGDVLVLPVHPNPTGYYRPYMELTASPLLWIVEPVAEVVADDVLSGQTIPNFYDGINPVVGRDHPRLRVVVYRVVHAWVVGG